MKRVFFPSTAAVLCVVLLSGADSCDSNKKAQAKVSARAEVRQANGDKLRKLLEQRGFVLVGGLNLEGHVRQGFTVGECAGVAEYVAPEKEGEVGTVSIVEIAPYATPIEGQDLSPEDVRRRVLEKWGYKC